MGKKKKVIKLEVIEGDVAVSIPIDRNGKRLLTIKEKIALEMGYKPQ